MKRLLRILYWAALGIAGMLLGLIAGIVITLASIPKHVEAGPGDGILLFALWFITIPMGIVGVIFGALWIERRKAAKRSVPSLG